MSGVAETQHHDPSKQNTPRSPTNHENLSPATSLETRHSPETRAESDLEQYLLEPEGRKELLNIYGVIDSAANIVRSLDEEITAAIHQHRHTIYGRLLAGREDDRLPDGSDSLMRAELVELYDQNAPISECLRRFQQNKVKGDRDAAKVYLATAKIFMHFVRFEWLQDIHDPQSEAWQRRWTNLGLFTGNVMETNLPSIPGRPNTFTRQSSPSDQLPYLSD